MNDSPHPANLPASSAAAGGRRPSRTEPEPVESRGAAHEEYVPVTGPHVDDRTLAHLLHDLDVAGDWHDDA